MKNNTVFLNAEWRKLIIINYSIDPLILKKFIPAKTELDFWNGKCYVSLVGFRFLDTKVRGCKIPFHINFEEVNLRFYVKHHNGKEWKRGVIFIKEIVPKRMITRVANSVYKEKYETMKMEHVWKNNHDHVFIEYALKKKQWHRFSVEVSNEPKAINPGSEPDFITEHYWGYTKISETQTAEYEVTHPRWEIYPVKKHKIDLDFREIYGNEFAFMNDLEPVSVFLAEGSEIKVMKGKKL